MMMRVSSIKDESNIVTRIRVHNFLGTNRPVNPLDLVVTWVVNDDGGRLRRLAVSHLTGTSKENKDIYEECREGKGVLILNI